ncbi:hypothetical protein A3E97_00445 [Candidatus Uhrbacteria bacterium RIFCSPHIGHO2_12_FULL_47_12]|nr:MAG: hypothetical protein A3E97_00445 [Candidatus Uhrbacteria bacterium RIFCSPHIGHO2_12_FULL_47_12]OGL94363.1 MAG: hypothetical protein A3H12_05200 [Candidatus Uhrbacteria bacterium RIFCSPLOWO2_12_FULL_47_9]
MNQTTTKEAHMFIAGFVIGTLFGFWYCQFMHAGAFDKEKPSKPLDSKSTSDLTNASSDPSWGSHL